MLGWWSFRSGSTCEFALDTTIVTHKRWEFRLTWALLTLDICYDILYSNPSCLCVPCGLPWYDVLTTDYVKLIICIAHFITTSQHDYLCLVALLWFVIIIATCARKGPLFLSLALFYFDYCYSRKGPTFLSLSDFLTAPTIDTNHQRVSEIIFCSLSVLCLMGIFNPCCWCLHSMHLSRYDCTIWHAMVGRDCLILLRLLSLE